MTGTGLLDAVAFTAAREWDNRSVQVALNVLCQVPPARAYVTGGCRNGDAFLGHYLAVTQRGAEHFVILPANRSQVDPWWESGAHAFRVRALPLHEWEPWPALRRAALESGEIFKPKVTVLEMPAGSTYRDRNAELVRWGTVTYGLPAYPEEDPRSRRSGTWQAIRMARKAGTLISWTCVQPPYHGRIERYVSTFLPKET
jgi:hypothetical protein